MKTLDVRNLGCPIPTINLRKALKSMQLGEQIEVMCNHKDAANDIRALVVQSKNILRNTVIDTSGKVPVTTFTIEKAAP